MAETGKFLAQAQSELKPVHLWSPFLNEIGLGKSSAYNYIKIYRAFGDKLPSFAHLGVRKLQAVARLEEPVKYVETNLERIAAEPSSKLEEQVKASRRRKTGDKRRGPKTLAIEHGNVTMRPSRDGARLSIEGLDSDLQNKIIESIKALLSQA